MQIPQLPFENPSTYRRLKGLLVSGVLPGLERVVRPVLEALSALPASDDKAQRTVAKNGRVLALTQAMHQQRRQLLADTLVAVKHLAPKPLANTQDKSDEENDDEPGTMQVAEAPTKQQSKARHDTEKAEEDWELLSWLLYGLLVWDFPDKKVPPKDRAGAPFYLYRLAQQLAGSREWRGANANTCVQQVLYELSAEHTRERLQGCFGMGGKDSVNHITKVLRPVDRHQNGALHVLKNREGLPDAAVLVVGRPLNEQDLAIRRVVRDWHIKVLWLMNWTAHYADIRHILAGQSNLDVVLSDKEMGSPLSKNRDVYLATPEATESKLTWVLQQLADLHQSGHAITAQVDLYAMLDRLDQAADDNKGQPSEALPTTDTTQPDESSPWEQLQDQVANIAEPSFRVAVLLRLHHRYTPNQDKQALEEQLIAVWSQDGGLGLERGLFAELDEKKPEPDQLTDARLAKLVGLEADDFANQADAMAEQLMATKTPISAFVEVGASLRKLEELQHDIQHERERELKTRQPSKRRLELEREYKWKAERLMREVNRPEAFDGGLFGYLGLPTDPPELKHLTDDVLAWAADLPLEVYQQQVAEAVSQFDARANVGGH